MPRRRAQLGRWQPWTQMPAWSLTSRGGSGTHLPSAMLSHPCDGVGDSVYLQVVTQWNPVYGRVLSLPLGLAAKRKGVCERVPHRVPMEPSGQGPGPAHLLLHQVQRQGRAVGKSGGRRDLLLAALPAQALEVEGGSPMR